MWEPYSLEPKVENPRTGQVLTLSVDPEECIPMHEEHVSWRVPDDVAEESGHDALLDGCAAAERSNQKGEMLTTGETATAVVTSHVSGCEDEEPPARGDDGDDRKTNTVDEAGPHGASQIPLQSASASANSTENCSSTRRR